ncbi:unnamed protein product [Amoebophrya sp. A120]|nr:unnamed protein product [Amoebophrya sp. A120]|eukprot:GSA120T00004196001.1
MPASPTFSTLANCILELVFIILSPSMSTRLIANRASAQKSMIRFFFCVSRSEHLIECRTRRQSHTEFPKTVFFALHVTRFSIFLFSNYRKPYTVPEHTIILVEKEYWFVCW